MDEQEQAPEQPGESPQEGNEVTGDESLIEETETAETTVDATPVKEEWHIKAVQAEKRKRQEAERELQQLRALALEPKEAAPLNKPRPDSFTDYDEYVEALADWKIEQREQARAKLTREQVQQREHQKLQTKAAKDAAEAAKKYDDFYTVAEMVVLPQSSLEALYESDLGTEITYFLGKNPAELERISDLSPKRQLMELGKIETKLAAKAANPEAKRNKEATKVEAPGQGFEKPKVNLDKIKERAIATGDWTQYLEATGNL